MRPGVKLEFSPLAILLIALAYFFDTSGIVSAVVPAAAVHELGHFLALRLCKCRLRCLRLGLAGLEMDYAPRQEGLRSLLCAAAGPALGGLYALCACVLGGDFWLISGAASFLLTVFNLLPILPLDGGRVLRALLPERAALRFSRCAALALTGAGVYVALAYHSAALAVAGLWLVLCNFCTRDRE